MIEINEEELVAFSRVCIQEAFKTDISCGIFLQAVGSTLWNEYYPDKLKDQRNFLTAVGYGQLLFRLIHDDRESVKRHCLKEDLFCPWEKMYGPEESVTVYQSRFLDRYTEKCDVFWAFLAPVRDNFENWEFVKKEILNLTFPMGIKIEDDLVLLQEGTYNENIIWLTVKLAQIRGLLMCPGAIPFTHYEWPLNCCPVNWRQSTQPVGNVLLVGLSLIQVLEEKSQFNYKYPHMVSSYLTHQKSFFTSYLREYRLCLGTQSIGNAQIYLERAEQYGIDLKKWVEWTEDGLGYPKKDYVPIFDDDDDE